MPIISIKTVKGVVLTSDEQKRELMKKMTDTFVSVVGEVARPYTYCLIEDVPIYEWSVAGVPLPDLPFLTGDYQKLHDHANAIMREVMAAGIVPGPPVDEADEARKRAAEAQWAGMDLPPS